MDINKYKGIVKLNIYGEDRFFKFGTAQMAMFCDLQGQKLEEAIASLNDTKDLKTNIHFYLSAAVSYVDLVNDEEGTNLKRPTYSQVANWFDGLLDDQKKQIDETAFKQAFPNGEAPDQQGQS